VGLPQNAPGFGGICLGESTLLPFKTMCRLGPRSVCTCQMAPKSVKLFKQGTQM